jgi:hypothetical protein
MNGVLRLPSITPANRYDPTLLSCFLYFETNASPSFDIAGNAMIALPMQTLMEGQSNLDLRAVERRTRDIACRALVRELVDFMASEVDTLEAEAETILRERSSAPK